MEGAAVIIMMMGLEGVLFAVLGVPLMMRRVPPNRWYGFRTPATLADPAIWYPVNVYTGKWLIAIGLASLLASILLWVAPGVTENLAVTVLLSIIGGGIALMIVFSFRRLAQVKAEQGS